MYFLIDCNNFFVSCERLFQPKLQNLPTVVLSNNDGCFIARSNEAKQLGIPMGAPFFKYHSLIKKHNIQVRSANFPLYIDISLRVKQMLLRLLQNTESYSIDEVFAEIPHISHNDLITIASKTQSDILRGVGIPISVGIGQTKTLAKMAADFAKKSGKPFLLDPLQDTNAARLNKTRLDKIWGIGSKTYSKLSKKGIRSVKDLIEADRNSIRNIGALPLLQTVLELRGIPCITNTRNKPPKSISSTRTFAKPTQNPLAVEAALARYIAIAARQLRDHKQKTSLLTVFITPKKGRSTSITVQLPEPTNTTSTLVTRGLTVIRTQIQKNLPVRRAGVVLTHLLPENETHLNLFHQATYTGKQQQSLNKALDSINTKWGDDTIVLAVQNMINYKTLYKQEYKSPQYTTKWNELPLVY